MVPAGGKPGEELEVTFLGDPAGPIKQKVKLPADDDHGYWRLHCQTPEGISPTGFKFRLARPARTRSRAGANNAAAAATPGAAGHAGAFNGVVVEARRGRTTSSSPRRRAVFDIRCYARQLGSPLDPVLYVGNAQGGGDRRQRRQRRPGQLLPLHASPRDGEYTALGPRPPEEGRRGLLLPRSR